MIGLLPCLGYGTWSLLLFTRLKPHVWRVHVCLGAKFYRMPLHRNAVHCVWSTDSRSISFEWNHHHIRHSNMAELPHGVPEVLYQFPNIHGDIIIALFMSCAHLRLICVSVVEDFKHELFSEVENLFYEAVVIVCLLYQSIADIILKHYSIIPPTNFEDAWFLLVDIFSDIMNE